MTLLETRPVASDLPYRFTVEQFWQMLESGVLSPEGRFELLRGVIYPLNPMLDGHYDGLGRLTMQLAPKLAGKAMVVSQVPIAIGELYSQPIPDFIVVKLEQYDGKVPPPDKLSLVVEVSLSSLVRDQQEKLPLYARHGIPEYWVLDVKANRLEVYRDPHGEEYRSKKILLEGELATLLEFPDVQIQWW